ncbi:MAG: hypothetical protein ABIK43_06315, partial [candidate division WOR-3 bacterium]
MKSALWLAICMMLIFPGCATFLGTYDTARVAPKGEFQIGAAVTPVNIYTTQEPGVNTRTFGFLLFPFPEVNARVGISDRTELGFRWGLGPGLTATSKYQLARGRTDAAISLNGSYYRYGAGNEAFGYYGLESRVMMSRECPDALPYSASAGVSLLGIFLRENGQSSSG